MKIKITQGCTSDFIEVDGKDIRDCSEAEILDHILPKLKEYVLMGCCGIKEVIECFQYEDYEDLGTCDQCFDHVSRVTYNI
jgi:hypothetical protein